MHELGTSNGTVTAKTLQLASSIADLLQELQPPLVTRADDVVVQIAPTTGNVAIHRIPRQPGARVDGVLTMRTELPACRDRTAAAESLVEGVLTRCRLRTGSAHEWLSAASDALEGPTHLEMYVQHDEVSDLVTLQLWSREGLVHASEHWARP